MALKVFDYVMPDETIIPEAYVRIKNVLIESNDYEFLEPVDDSEDLKVTWVTRQECKSAVYVYADEVCRKNQVSPIHWFVLDFQLNSDMNPFEAAYNILKSKYQKTEDC